VAPLLKREERVVLVSLKRIGINKAGIDKRMIKTANETLAILATRL
jgi:hypothetical protein